MLGFTSGMASRERLECQDVAAEESQVAFDRSTAHCVLLVFRTSPWSAARRSHEVAGTDTPLAATAVTSAGGVLRRVSCSRRHDPLALDITLVKIRGPGCCAATMTGASRSGSTGASFGVRSRHGGTKSVFRIDRSDNDIRHAFSLAHNKL